MRCAQKALHLQGAFNRVMTTGNTVNECAKMLRLSGAYQVFCVVAAKTVIEKTEDKKDD